MENNSQDQSLINSIENNFDDVPFDVALDILMRLPAKSVARFLLVSKFWSETIRSRHFITSFQIRSALQQQPCLLVMFTDFGSQDSYFFSVSSSTTTTTSYLSRVTCPFEYSVYQSHYVNGLISLGCGRDKCIANPSIGSSTVSVGDKTELGKSFLGYDPVNDEYKILVCSIKGERRRRSKLSYTHQVVTLGDKNEEWRRIDYETRYHCPMLDCLCIDGVLYYVAHYGSLSSKASLMRFSLESEKLDLFTSLPVEVHALLFNESSSLISYKKKVALATKTSDYHHVVWVLDQHGWVKKSFSLGCSTVNHWARCILFIRGTTLTGEFILAPKQVYSDMFCVIYYNHDTGCYRQTCVEVPEDYGFKHSRSSETQAMVFSDYVDCFRFL